MLTQDQTLDQTALVEQYGGVIHYVLHSQAYYRGHPDYEDFYQELYLKLWDLALKFKGQPLEAQSRSRFVGYVKPALRYYLWDLAQAASRRRSREPLGLLGNGGGAEPDSELVADLLAQDLKRSETGAWQAQQGGTQESSQGADAFLAAARSRLSDKEADFLTFLLDPRLTDTAKASQLGISLSSYDDRRTRLATKLWDLKALLKGEG